MKITVSALRFLIKEVVDDYNRAQVYKVGRTKEEMFNIDLIDPAPWNRENWSGEMISADGCSTKDFDRDDVKQLIAWWSYGAGGDGDTAGLVRLNDGRYVAWEAFYANTGDGFRADAYGGDADIIFANSIKAALNYLPEEPRNALKQQIGEVAEDESLLYPSPGAKLETENVRRRNKRK
jgi:hypothetical protein